MAWLLRELSAECGIRAGGEFLWRGRLWLQGLGIDYVEADTVSGWQLCS